MWQKYDVKKNDQKWQKGVMWYKHEDIGPKMKWYKIWEMWQKYEKFDENRRFDKDCNKIDTGVTKIW